MKRKLKFGVIGTGAIAADFCEALAASPSCEVVNVVGTSADKSRAFAQRFALPRAAASLNELLRGARACSGGLTPCVLPRRGYTASAQLTLGARRRASRQNPPPKARGLADEHEGLGADAKLGSRAFQAVGDQAVALFEIAPFRR